MSLVDTESQEFTDAVRRVIDELGLLDSENFIAPVTGNPNGQVPSGRGRLALRNDGGAATTLYVKEADNVAGDPKQGWAAK